jgi:predicted RNase H-like HicB family nuclease
MASVVGMSNLIAEGTTEEEALSNIKAILETTLSQGKFLPLEVQELEKIPSIKFAGILAEDQTFDDKSEY